MILARRLVLWGKHITLFAESLYAAEPTPDAYRLLEGRFGDTTVQSSMCMSIAGHEE